MGAATAMTIFDQLKRAGAVLVRTKNHQIWRLPNGRNYVMSQTPSDGRAVKNQLSVLRKMLKAEHR